MALAINVVQRGLRFVVERYAAPARVADLPMGTPAMPFAGSPDGSEKSRVVGTLAPVSPLHNAITRSGAPLYSESGASQWRHVPSYCKFTKVGTVYPEE